MTQAATPGRGRYEVERTLGRGGMATVYLAHDTVLGRPVALKVLAEHLAGDESFRARFLREARLAARIAHPNVVQVYDAGGDEAGLFIAMEYVDGESLAEELARRGRLSAGEVVDLGRQLAAALAAAHAAGLVHRDVKPPNVLRARDGTVKLGDFGIAHSHDSTALTAHGSVLGTAAYLAPEQARAEPVTGAADLYALGVVLYEALTGRWPHEGRASPSSCCAASRSPSRRRAPSSRMCRRRSTRRSSVASPCVPSSARLGGRARRRARGRAAGGGDAPLPRPTETRATQVLTCARRADASMARRGASSSPRWRSCSVAFGGSAARVARDRDDGASSDATSAPDCPDATVRAKPPPRRRRRCEPSAADARSRRAEQRRQQLEAKRALEEQKHATKDKPPPHPRAHKHALDDRSTRRRSSREGAGYERSNAKRVVPSRPSETMRSLQIRASLRRRHGHLHVRRRRVRECRPLHEAAVEEDAHGLRLLHEQLCVEGARAAVVGGQRRLAVDVAVLEQARGDRVEPQRPVEAPEPEALPVGPDLARLGHLLAAQRDVQRHDRERGRRHGAAGAQLAVGPHVEQLLRQRPGTCVAGRS